MSALATKLTTTPLKSLRREPTGLTDLAVAEEDDDEDEPCECMTTTPAAVTIQENTSSGSTTQQHEQHNVDLSDQELIALAEEKFEQEKVLEAYRLLQRVRDPKLLGIAHRSICATAWDCEAAIADLIGEPDDDEAGSGGWKKQSESHGKRDTVVHYKIDHARARLDCRLETPIEASLLIPLISVMNESDLYQTWVPSWKTPKIGVQSSRQLRKIGRVNQMLQVIGDVPWPFSPREVVMRTDVVDEIDAGGFFAVRLYTVYSGDGVPPKDPANERVDFEGALLFRPCPKDRPAMIKTTDNKNEEPMILVSFKMFCDPHLTGIPSRVLNFITRTVVGQIWQMLLRVAESVRDGKRPGHKLAIEEKPDLYRFVRERVDVMLSQLQEERDNDEQMRFIAYLQS